MHPQAPGVLAACAVRAASNNHWGALRPRIMTSLQGKIALVTGSTSGIGLGIARRLAHEGAQLVLHGLGSPSDIEAAIASVNASGAVPASFERADLREPAEITAMMERIHARHGAIDILVNNGGIQHVDKIVDFPPEKWDEMLAVNLSASFHTMRLAIPRMLQRNWGRIINMASVSGIRARAGKPAYVATKHALVGLTKSVAIELAPTPITCNAICPGWVDTPLVQKQIVALAERTGQDHQSATRALISARQPSGQFVTVEQIGGMCVFLCSEDASEIRGASMAMDGATTAA